MTKPDSKEIDFPIFLLLLEQAVTPTSRVKGERKLMKLLQELIQFLFYSLLIVVISKYILVPILRKLAESLNLKAKTVGNIAGIATSMPEFLSVSFAALAGLIGTSIFNILSSNIINLGQYILAILLNKNTKVLQNKALKIDLIMVIITIIIPILMLLFNIEANGGIVPIFILLFALFYYINSNTHKLYLQKEQKQEENIIQQESRFIKGKKKIIVKYSIYLLLTGIALFIVGNLLSNSLESLCLKFNIPEFIIGISLGFITSLPELITFFEAQKHHKSSNSKLGVVEATNNLLTSNVLNLFIIQSIGILLYIIFV